MSYDHIWLAAHAVKPAQHELTNEKGRGFPTTVKFDFASPFNRKRVEKRVHPHDVTDSERANMGLSERHTRKLFKAPQQLQKKEIVRTQSFQSWMPD